MSLSDYRQFIASRAPKAKTNGFTPRPINSKAKAHQDAVLAAAHAVFPGAVVTASRPLSALERDLNDLIPF